MILHVRLEGQVVEIERGHILVRLVGVSFDSTDVRGRRIRIEQNEVCPINSSYTVVPDAREASMPRRVHNETRKSVLSVVVQERIRRHRRTRRASKYSTSADRPTISTIRTRSSVPSASVSCSSSPGMKWTGCCLPSSIAIFDA